MHYRHNFLSGLANRVLGELLDATPTESPAERARRLHDQGLPLDFQDAAGDGLAHSFCRVFNTDKTLQAVGGDLTGLFQLLAHAGLNLDPRNRAEKSPLHRAASLGNQAAMRALMKVGARVDEPFKKILIDRLDDHGRARLPATEAPQQAWIRFFEALGPSKSPGSLLGKRSLEAAGLSPAK